MDLIFENYLGNQMDSTPVTAKDERDDGLTSAVAKVTKWRECAH